MTPPVLDKRLDRWHSELAQLFDLTETCFSRLKKEERRTFLYGKKGNDLFTQPGTGAAASVLSRNDVKLNSSTT